MRSAVFHENRSPAHSPSGFRFILARLFARELEIPAADWMIVWRPFRILDSINTTVIPLLGLLTDYIYMCIIIYIYIYIYIYTVIYLLLYYVILCYIYLDHLSTQKNGQSTGFYEVTYYVNGYLKVTHIYIHTFTPKMHTTIFYHPPSQTPMVNGPKYPLVI